MFNISNFLNKFSKTLESTEINLNMVSDVIFDNIGIKIVPDDIEIKNYIIFLKSSPAVLNKIFIRKEKILQKINSYNSLKVVDIKTRM